MVIREKVARAMCQSCYENPDHKGDATGNDYRWQDYLESADAAIDAVNNDRDSLAELIIGMEVSVDVSTGEHDIDHRYFGVIDDVVYDDCVKNRLVLLVQHPEKNFTSSPDSEPVAWFFPDDEEHGYRAFSETPPTQEQVA